MSSKFLDAIKAQNKALKMVKNEVNVLMQMNQTSHQYLVGDTVNLNVAYPTKRL